MQMLTDKGHQAIPISPTGTVVLGQAGYKALPEVPQTIDTVTMYLRPERQTEVIADIIQTGPKRVIFNPGTENPSAYERLEAAGIGVQEACTLVLLSTGQF